MGDVVEDGEGVTVGGDVLGDVVGKLVGDVVGDVVGDSVGDAVGDSEGDAVGDAVGDVEDFVGEGEGERVAPGTKEMSSRNATPSVGGSSRFLGLYWNSHVTRRVPPGR